VARRCSRTACAGAAVATLTYVYADQTAVLGPLATYAEPHTYDLCAGHADRLSAPRGWATVRLLADLAEFAEGDAVEVSRTREDDLLAVAAAVNETGRLGRRARPPVASPPAAAPPAAAPPAAAPPAAAPPAAAPPAAASATRSSGLPAASAPERSGMVETGRRGHLRVLRDH